MLFSLVVLQCSLLAPAWELLQCYSWAKAVTRLSHPEPVPLGIPLLVLYNPPAKLLENPEITNTGSLYLLSEFVFTFRVSRLKTLLLETLWACASCANGPAALFALSLIFGRFFFFLASFQKHAEVFQVPSHQRIPELSPTILLISKAKVSGVVWWTAPRTRIKDQMCFSLKNLLCA